MEKEEILVEEIQTEKEYFNVGGVEFSSEEEARVYLLETKDKLELNYFKLLYSPDTSQGLGFYKEKIIGIDSDLGENLVYHIIKEILGSPYIEMYGDKLPKYSISEPFKFESTEEYDSFFAKNESTISFSPQKRSLFKIKNFQENPIGITKNLKNELFPEER